MLDTLIPPLEKTFSGEVAAAYHDFGTGSSALYRATVKMRSASLIKLPILICALQAVARAELDLSQRFELKREVQVSGSGVLQTLQAGLRPSLHDLLTLMVIVSDNTATNMLIDLLGLARVNGFIRQEGFSQTGLVGKLQLPESAQNAAQRRGERNHSCAADVLGMLLGLERRDLLPEDLTQVALGILKKQQFTEALARYLPRDAELTTGALSVASKSGSLRGLWHDAGLVYNAQGQPLYALVVMTEESEDKSFGWEQEGMMLIATLSKQVYERWHRDG